MSGTVLENEFYTSLVMQDDFAALADTSQYTPLPDDWWVGTSDIIGSTKAIEDGRYKAVNMVAAAVISAQINVHRGAAFPYIFGGDGSGFAVPSAWKLRSEKALAAVRAWARDEFDMDLRIGMTPVSTIRTAGQELAVARFRVSEGVDYAMFSGGGLCWAEAQMKAGVQTIPEAPAGTRPDLSGLSCRWNHMPSRYGKILSIVMLPKSDAKDQAFSEIAGDVVKLVNDLERSGNPAEMEGPGVKWPPSGATLEAHARRGDGSFGAAKRKALFESFIAWVLIVTGILIGGFDARKYRRTVGNNADFRKFEDGLKMTLDCDPDTEKQLRSLLEKGAENGSIRFGIHSQSEAMMTCMVPSIMTDDHVHFVDGAAGGYTAAARSIKAQSK